MVQSRSRCPRCLAGAGLAVLLLGALSADAYTSTAPATTSSASASAAAGHHTYTPYRPGGASVRSQSKVSDEWRRSGGIVVLRNFLRPDDYKRVVDEVKAASKSLRPETNSLAVGRLVA
eukprot:CAMPEP_0119529210 /NCGR_PEP_ID=MMETSP1344-20130328/43265_1 /TAXON_ID=236787 /ORGANISM="Florenciella parvula, Strain CCMP2471" /LENGTH=118 /DNA_ID=CAMNT_0007568793 /DNA_START=111 /DNA_END=464 /DNA_ORIENTATION=-